MMRATQTNLVFCHQIGPIRWTGWRPTNQNINKIIITIREKTKLKRYFGANMMRHADREMFGAWGDREGPNRHVRYVRQSKSGRQFEHYNTREGDCGVFEHTKFGQPYGTPTGSYVDAFGQLPNTKFYHTHLDPHHRGNRSATTALLESWGNRVVNITDKNAPRVGDLLAHRHKLYITNFPWIKDPVTTHAYGDADWSWKNSDQFDYDKTRSKDHASFDHSVLCQTEEAVRARQLGKPLAKKASK